MKKKVLVPIFVILSLVAFYKSGVRAMRGYKGFEKKMVVASDPSFRWIKENTSLDDTFIVPPNDERFYIHAERPIFASFKHSAQKEVHILEWYRRMRLLNGGSEPVNSGFSMSSEVTSGFYKLSADYLRKNFGEAKYVFARKGARFKLPMLFESERFVVYSFGTK